MRVLQRFLPVLLLAVLLAAFFSASANGMPSWTTETVDTNGALTTGISMVLDSNSSPHICYTAYQDGNPRNPLVLMYARWTGTGWDRQVVAQNGVVTNTGLALDAGGNPHIAFSVKDSLMYASKAGANWAIQTVDSSTTAGSINSPSLALDSVGNPRIAYCYQPSAEADFSCFFRYASGAGSNWTIQAVDTVEGIFPAHSLALDARGHPNIVYGVQNVTQAATPSTWIVKYAVLHGSSWSVQTLPSDANITDFGNIAADANGNSHFTYTTNQNSNISLVYAGWNGSAWATQTVDSLGGYWAAGALALETNGTPHISYVKGVLADGNFEAALEYAKCTGEAWSIQTVNTTDFVNGVGSLALDSNGFPHLCYFAQPVPASYVASVLYSTTAETSTPSPTITEFSPSVILSLATIVTLIAVCAVRKMKQKTSR
jgi:hypothetical protein